VKADVIEFGPPTQSGGEYSEPERSVGGPNSTASRSSQASGYKVPYSEVTAQATRRRFSPEYKLRILQEAESCDIGGVAALLRREALYSSNLTQWRHQRDKAAINGLGPHKRGRKAISRNPLAAEYERLQRENKRLEKRLRKAEIIIDVQKKLCDLLGLTVPPIEESEKDE
jgi:transposase-like protein